MAARVRLKYLRPSHDRDGRLLSFMTGTPDRRAPPDFLTPDEVPEPEKGAGWFECQRARVGPWMKWKRCGALMATTEPAKAHRF